TRADNSEKEPDACFRPRKPKVSSPSGSNGKEDPWPNLVIEVAYSESEQHVLDKVKKYWLDNLNRVHDVIVVKIDPVSSDQIPKRMQAWHFCISDKRYRYRDVSHRTYFEFGTHDKYGNPTNIQQNQCIINISLD
ncbi:8146_t:CDS:2, partial [Funneliformis geosporum]